jgi:hypothetical protein
MRLLHHNFSCFGDPADSEFSHAYSARFASAANVTPTFVQRTCYAALALVAKVQLAAVVSPLP